LLFSVVDHAHITTGVFQARFSISVSRVRY